MSDSGPGNGHLLDQVKETANKRKPVLRDLSDPAIALGAGRADHTARSPRVWAASFSIEGMAPIFTAAGSDYIVARYNLQDNGRI